MKGELLWGKNAMNLLCYMGQNYLLLDSKSNLHGNLSLSSFKLSDEPIIIHLTSGGDDLIQGKIEFMVSQESFNFFIDIVKMNIF